ncbi:MAG: Gfo/Idh/MocA family oxidoreductase [Planctomycetota bacterium]
MAPAVSRRDFLRSSAAAGAGMAFGTRLLPRANTAPVVDTTLRVLSIGVVGTIGAQDRKQVQSHPNAEIVGLCDVDANQLATAAKDHPKAFTCRDYREAFAQHAGDFDAVIVSTPDHSHAPIMLTALAHDKHVYGQKPLVHQLEELVMMEQALKVKPDLVTQLGNQRMVYPGRRAFVEILRAGQLGKAIEAYAWVGSPNSRTYFNLDRELKEPSTPPENLDWNLWQGPALEQPYREGLCPVVWRSWWNYGTNGLGDWGCHVLDVILFSYDELDSPIAVQTHAPAHPNEFFHVHPCRATVTYEVDSPRFARRFFPIYYSDSAQAPSRAALGIPAGNWPEENMTVVVCEGGVIALSAGGKCEVWRDGYLTDGLKMPYLPDFPKLNHWHAWVDNCLGKKTELRTPFRQALRITEPALLAVKATWFPGVELRWDKKQLAFTNHAEASKTIVRREYREGFAPPVVG